MAQRPKHLMPVSQRAKIFAPFDALRGFSAALRAKEKIRRPRRSLLDDKLEELNSKACALKKGDQISVLYYSEDDYLSVSGSLSEIDPVNRVLSVAGKEIGFDDIYELDTVIDKPRED